MPEIIIEGFNNKFVAALKVYYATDEGSNPWQHFRGIIDIRHEAAGLFIQNLQTAVALFPIQPMENKVLTGIEVNRHLNMIQVIVLAS